MKVTESQSGMQPLSLRKKFWLQALGWLGLVYITLPIARPVSEFLRKKIPFNLSINLLFIGLLGAIFIHLFWKIRIKKPSSYFLLLGLAFIGGLIIGLIKIPEEKIHFLQYSFLAFLTFRAVNLDHSKLRAYILTFFITSASGWIDEGIQFLLPGRYYDLRDVFFNILGAILGLCVTFIFIRETVSKKTTGAL